jgi:predicted esterase
MNRANNSRKVVRSRRVGAITVLALVLIAGAVLAKTLLSVATDGARITEITIHSRFVHASEAVALVTPRGGGAGRPLLIFLHGRGGDQDSELNDAFFKGLNELGARAPDVAFPSGGNYSYWHDRGSGDWAQYVLDEVIPTAVRLLHANPARVAIGGISMGGFGAYDIARLAPGKFCAVGGHSAAIFPAAAYTAPGAFDDATDFTRNNILAIAAAHPHLYGRARLWLDGGNEDPFHAADETLAAELGIHMHVWPGAHDSAYWDAHWDTYMRFYANALADCKPG